MEFWDRTSKSLKPFSILVYGGALKNPENKHRTIKKQPWMKIYFLLYRNSVFPPSHVSCRGCRFSYPFVLKWVDGNLVSRHLEPRVAAGTHRFLWFCNALGPVTTLAQKPMENLPEWTIFRWIFLRICYFFWFFTGWTMGFITIKQPNWDHIFWELFPSIFIANPRFSYFETLINQGVQSNAFFFQLSK